MFCLKLGACVYCIGYDTRKPVSYTKRFPLLHWSSSSPPYPHCSSHIHSFAPRGHPQQRLQLFDADTGAALPTSSRIDSCVPNGGTVILQRTAQDSVDPDLYDVDKKL